MPTYDFKNKKTGEVKEYFMSYKDLDQFKKDNPDLQQQLSAPKVVYRTEGDVLKKAGDGWKEVQDKIKGGLPPRLRGCLLYTSDAADE